MQGYLAPETLPDSLKLLAPLPAPGSAAQALDEDIARANFALEATARWTQASKDADLNFPAAASIFSCSLGVEISEERTPRPHTLDSHKAEARVRTTDHRPITSKYPALYC